MLPASSLELENQLDIFADQAAQHFLGMADHRVHVDHPRLRDLPAAERQQLVGELGRAVGRRQSLFHVRAQRIDGRQLVQHHAVVAGDDRQHVIEVVRHATRQPAHRFHFLRVLQLLLQRLALADVAHEGDGEHALFDFDIAQADFHGKFRAVLAPAREFHADAHGPDVRAGEILRALAAVRRAFGFGQQQLDGRDPSNSARE